MRRYHVWQPEGGGWLPCRGEGCALCASGDVPRTADEIAGEDAKRVFGEDLERWADDGGTVADAAA